MRKRIYLLTKVAACLGLLASFAFAGFEPTPFLPIWKIIIIIFGG